MYTKNNKVDEIKQERKGNSALSKSKTLSLCNKPSIEELEKTLYTLKSSLPTQSAHIGQLFSHLSLLKKWQKATPSQKGWLSCIYSSARKNSLQGKNAFRMAHSITSNMLGRCYKTSQRALTYWVDCDVVGKSTIKLKPTVTVNELRVNQRYLDIVFIGDQLYYNYHDKTGKNKFVTLYEYIVYKTRELINLEQKRRQKTGYFFYSTRQCPTDQEGYKNIRISTIDISKEKEPQRKVYLYDRKLTEGIVHLGYKSFSLDPYQLSQLRKFDEEIVLDAIDAVEKLPKYKVFRLRNPAGFLYRCCQNLSTGNTSWKTPFPVKRRSEILRDRQLSRYRRSHSVNTMSLQTEYRPPACDYVDPMLIAAMDALYKDR